MKYLLKSALMAVLMVGLSSASAMAQSKVITFDSSVLEGIPNAKAMGIVIPDSTIYTAEELKAMAADPFGYQKTTMKKGPKKAITLCWFNFWYTSRDAHGNPIRLSAKIAWKSTDIDHVILYCPYTHCANSECASEDISSKEDKVFNSGSLIVTPDGEGFGDTKDRTQMYLNHEVWAVQEVDCLAAAMEYLEEWKNKEDYPHLKDNWDTVIAGMSQGGGTALATLRYMEEHSQCDQFRVSFCNICCGPYDPALTLKTYFESWYRLTYPCVIPMVIKSYMESYPDVFKGYKEEDFYAESYLAIKSEIDAALAGKEMGADDINKIFFTKLSCTQYLQSNLLDYRPACFITEILRPEIIDSSSDLAKKLISCLERNNVLRDDWQPQHWVKVAYCKEDAVVPYDNTAKLFLRLKSDNYSSTSISTMGHVTACAEWIAVTTWANKSY